jgi:hypothetical protein
MTKQEKNDLLKRAMAGLKSWPRHPHEVPKEELLLVLLEDAAPRCMTNRIIERLRDFVSQSEALESAVRSSAGAGPGSPIS